MERLNYNGTHKLPDVFSKEDVMRIILQPLKSDKYWVKNKSCKDWGIYLRYRDVTLIATIYILGLRPNEACCLRFDDFDFQHSTVKIRGTSNKVKKDRVLPVPYNLIKFYEKYLSFPRARFWKGSPYLFPSLENDHISSGQLKRTMREKILKPLGLWVPPVGQNKKPKYSTYTLRHSRASHLLNKQILKDGKPDIYGIANLLGHSDIRYTQVYLHTDEKYIEYLRDMIS